MQPFGHNTHGPKIGGSVPFWGEGAETTSNTMWRGPRPTCMPSFILIRQTVWPQCNNVTDRQTDRQTDNGLIAYGKPFYKRSPKNYCTSIPVNTGMGDRLQTGKPFQLIASHPCQLSLLPIAAREMSVDQKPKCAVMLRCCGVERHGLFRLYMRACVW